MHVSYSIVSSYVFKYIILNVMLLRHLFNIPSVYITIYTWIGITT